MPSFINPLGKTDLGKFEGTTTALVKKIAKAIGVLYEPTRIRRKAKAIRDARIILGQTSPTALGIRNRTEKRLRGEQEKHQKNIESITNKALGLIAEDAKPDNMDEDWIVHYFEHSRIVSDEQMQTLWAKILAGEANTPGKFSRRTVALVSTLDKSDATMFETLCRFAANPDRPFLLIYDFRLPIYHDNGLSFSLLIHLDEIGLINRAPPLESRTIVGNFDDGFIDYFQDRIWVRFPNQEQKAIAVGDCTFTTSGQESATICNTTPIVGFPDFVRARWNKQGIDISEPEKADTTT